MEPWRSLWAKSTPFHPLWKHLLDAAAVSMALQNPLERDGWTSRQVAFVVGLHDVGKAEPVFQHQVEAFTDGLTSAGFPPTPDRRLRHERFSAHFLARMLKDRGLPGRYSDTVARAVVAHHGHWEEGAYDCSAPYARAQQELSDCLARTLSIDGLQVDTPTNLSAFGIRLAGQVVLSDWIASNEAYFTDPSLQDISDPLCYFEQSHGVAKSWVQALGLEPGTRPARPGDVVDKPRPVQQLLLELGLDPGLVVIEAPMGEGKTEAAWILAESWRQRGYEGMYVALPTMATSDSLFDRYRQDYLGRLEPSESVRLVHGMAWLRDDVEPEKVTMAGQIGDDFGAADQWFRPTKRALLAPHGVGTIDQALLGAMNARFGFMRLYGLNNRVLVVDEVHAYDSYMTTILKRLLSWCASLEIPVILLSATLSASQRSLLVGAYCGSGEESGQPAGYPLVTHAVANAGPRHFETPASTGRALEFIPHRGFLGDAAETARLAEERAATDGCVCVIANTVRQAQAIYEELRLPDAEKSLFHARFKAGDRLRIAEEVTTRFGKDVSQRPRKHVLVATQVVEQSLDVDFDAMITEIAPIDLLLQRSGRLHRHRPRDSASRLEVLVPPDGELRFGGTERVYSRYHLLRTLGRIGPGFTAELPADFRALIERVYGEPTLREETDEVLLAARQKWIEEMDEMETEAERFLLRMPQPASFNPIENSPVGDDSDDGNGWRAKTRYGVNDSTCLLMPEGEIDGVRHGKLSKRKVRQLYLGAVKVPHYIELDQPGEGYQPSAVGEGRLRGITLIPCGKNGEWCSTKYQLCYKNNTGLSVWRKGEQSSNV